MSQAGWYPDPSAPSVLRWWDGYRWTNDVRPWGPGADPGPDLADEAKYGRWASMALWVGAVIFSGQAFLWSLTLGRIFRAFRDQLNAPLRSDGTRAPLVLPHGVSGLYVVSQVGSLVLLAAEVIFLIWFYQAATVAVRAGIPARHSSGWAIAGWIIPIISLFFPYQSAVDFFPPGHPGRHRVNRWWALYLTMGVSLFVPILASLASTGLGLVLALPVAALAFAAAAAGRSLIAEVNRVHAGLLGARSR